MYRYLVAHLPGFRLERCGWDSPQSVVLVEEQRNALRIQSSSSAVQRQGVKPGMSLAAAQVLAPDLFIEVLDSEAESEDLTQLATQLLRISPNVAALPPDGIIAEIGGTRLTGHRLGDLAGQERAMMERIRLRLQELGHQSTIVIADDPETAHTLARWSTRNRAVPPGESRKALSTLPLEALALPGTDLIFLQGLGLQSIGEFAALPAASIAARMGSLGVTAHSMAQGRSQSRLMSPWTDQRPLMLTQELPDSVTQLDAMLFILNSMLRDACSRLATKGKAACQISLHFTLEEGLQSLSMQLGEPSRSPGRILQRLRNRLEHFQLAAPVVGLALEISESTIFKGSQAGLMNSERGSEAITDVMARIQDSLGRSRVGIPELQGRHRPETTWRARPLQSASLDSPQSERLLRLESRALNQDPVHHWQGAPSPSPPPRPPLMLEAPLTIDVRTPPEGIPLAVQVDGGWIEISSSSGPEQIETEWWRQPLHREYWHIHLEDGRSAWIYKEDGRWALHGWWDR